MVPWHQMANMSSMYLHQMRGFKLELSRSKLSHEEVGIGGGHPCTHCCAVDLEVVLFPENVLFKISEINSAKSAVGGDWISLVLRASVHAAIPSS